MRYRHMCSVCTLTQTLAKEFLKNGHQINVQLNLLFHMGSASCINSRPFKKNHVSYLLLEQCSQHYILVCFACFLITQLFLNIRRHIIHQCEAKYLGYRMVSTMIWLEYYEQK